MAVTAAKTTDWRLQPTAARCVVGGLAFKAKVAAKSWNENENENEDHNDCLNVEL